MTVIVQKIRAPQVQSLFAVAGKVCMVLSGLVLAQTASVLVVFSL